MDLTVPQQRRSASDTTAPPSKLDYVHELERLRQRRQRSRRNHRLVHVAAAVAIGGVLLAGYLVGDPTGKELFPPWATLWAGLAFFVLIGSFMSSQNSDESYKRDTNVLRHVIRALEEQQEHSELAEESVDLDSLLKANRNQLQTYHSISTDQAQEAFKMARLVVIFTAGVFLLACLLAFQGERVIGISLAGAAVVSSAVGGWVARTFLESYRISVTQAEAYFREPMVQGYLLAAHQIAQKMETPASRDEGLTQVMQGFLAAGLECARAKPPAVPANPQQESGTALGEILNLARGSRPST